MRNRLTRIACALTIACLTTIPANSHVLTVPLFDDSGALYKGGLPADGKLAAFITARNTRDEPITLYLVYSQVDPQGEAVLQQAVPFSLAALKFVTFRPVKNDPIEGPGKPVPNMLPGLGSTGSLQLYWIGGAEMASAIVGRFQQFDGSNSYGHVLLPGTW